MISTNFINFICKSICVDQISLKNIEINSTSNKDCRSTLNVDDTTYIDSKISDFNSRLTKNVNSLIYLYNLESYIEKNVSENRVSVDQLQELLEIKENIQKKTIESTNKLNHYRRLKLNRHMIKQEA